MPAMAIPLGMGHGRRASYWTRWPDEVEGPLWAGVHLNERAGVVAVVGVELFTEEPASARSSLGPAGEGVGEFFPVAPVALRTADIAGLGVVALLDRFRGSGVEAEAMAGSPGARSKRYTADHWRRVAQAVEAMRARGDREVAKGVAAAWTVSRPTAKKWIARAKAEGFL